MGYTDIGPLLDPLADTRRTEQQRSVLAVLSSSRHRHDAALQARMRETVGGEVDNVNPTRPGRNCNSDAAAPHFHDHVRSRTPVSDSAMVAHRA